MGLNNNAGMKEATYCLPWFSLGSVEKGKAFKPTLLLFEFTSR